MSEAFDILRREVDARNDETGKGGITKVAKMLGYARSSLSVFLTGRYRGSTENLEARILEVFTGTVECPYLGCPISRDECAAQRAMAMPTHDASLLKEWQAAQRTCRTCPNNPANPSDIKERTNAEN